MYKSPLEAYRSIERTTQTGRELEAAVLTQAARKLKECQENWNAEGHAGRLEAALKFNQMLWSIFQGELAKEDNPLPKKIRQDLLLLSGFVDKRIFEIMAYPSPEKLSVVININNNIAAGLRSSPVGKV